MATPNPWPSAHHYYCGKGIPEVLQVITTDAAPRFGTAEMSSAVFINREVPTGLQGGAMANGR